MAAFALKTVRLCSSLLEFQGAWTSWTAVTCCRSERDAEREEQSPQPFGKSGCGFHGISLVWFLEIVDKQTKTATGESEWPDRRAEA